MLRKGLEIYLHGWVAGSIETKAISASNLKLKLKLTEAELGKNSTEEEFRWKQMIPLDINFLGFELFVFVSQIE